MLRSSVRRLVGVAVALAALAACNSSEQRSVSPPPSSSSGTSAAPPSAQPEATVTSTSDAPATAATPAEVQPTIAALGAGGITVADDATLSAASKGLTVARWQANAWGQEVANHGGISGATLRIRFPTSATDVPMDAMVAAWLVAGTSPAATAAKSLVDVSTLKDPQQFAYPWAVLALFAEDTVFVPTAAVPDPAGGFTRRAHYADPCGAASALYESTIAQVKSWFEVKPGDGTIVSIAKTAISLFGSFIGDAVDKAVATVTAPIRTATAAIATASAIAAAAIPWSASITPTPEDVNFGIAPAMGDAGVFTLTVSTPLGVDWPDYVKSCAQLAGVSLPTISPLGKAVQWSALNDSSIAQIATKDDVVGGAAESPTAKMFFNALNEPEEQAKGDPIYSILNVSATVTDDRGEAIKSVLSSLVGSALGGLPSIVQDLLRGQADSILASVVELNGPSAYGIPFVTVVHHSMPDTTTSSSEPPPTPAIEPPAEGAGCIDRVFSSTVNGDGIPAVHVILRGDGTSVVDYNSSGPFYKSGAEAVARGTMEGTWSGGPKDFVVTLTKMAVSIKFKVQGIEVDVPVTEDMLPWGGTNTVTCADGPQLIVAGSPYIYLALPA